MTIEEAYSKKLKANHSWWGKHDDDITKLLTYKPRRKKGLETVCGHPVHFAIGLCKPCYRKQPCVKAVEKKTRTRWRFIRMGIDEETFNKMLSAQNGMCPICKTIPSTQKPWHIDHDHVTGVIRGILCQHCNLMLGNARDNPETLRSGIEYLAAKA